MTKKANAANPNKGAKETSVLVEMDGYGRRRLLTLRERKDGDVLIFVKNCDWSGPLLNGPKIKDRHISIHGSPCVPTDSMIKTTIKLERGGEESLVSWTEAIKAKVGWGWIFSCRWPALINPSISEYEPHAGSKELTLIKVHPTEEAVVVSVFVGSADTEFKSVPEEGFIVRSLVFNDKKIIFFASALKVPLISHGDAIWRTTEKASDAATEEEQYVNTLEKGSWPEDAVLAVVKQRAIVLRLRFWEDAAATFPPVRAYAEVQVQAASRELEAIGEIRIFPISSLPPQGWQGPLFGRDTSLPSD